MFFIVETLKAFGLQSFRFLKELGHRRHRVSGDICSYMYIYLIWSLAVEVQKGNAASVLGSLLLTIVYHSSLFLFCLFVCLFYLALSVLLSSLALFSLPFCQLNLLSYPNLPCLADTVLESTYSKYSNFIGWLHGSNFCRE